MSTDNVVTIRGKIIKIGHLDFGRGISVEVAGEIVDLTGMSIEEVKSLSPLLGEHVEIAVRGIA